MRVSAKLNNLRIAPRKIRLVTNLIKKMDVDSALDQLEVNIKKGSLPIKKLLESAISNGENNFGVARDNMYVYDVSVGAGTTLKRWMPKAYVRAGQILKRTSKIELILEERVEGKGPVRMKVLPQPGKKRQLIILCQQQLETPAREDCQLEFTAKIQIDHVADLEAYAERLAGGTVILGPP